MTDTKITSIIVEYASKIVKEGLFGKGDMIAIRAHDNMYITHKDCDFAHISASDIDTVSLESAKNENALFADIFKAREDIIALCHCHPKWVAPVAKLGLTIPAVLDDMAQIVGPSCKTSANNTKSIIKTLGGRNSCLIKDNGCMTSGRTMDEAYTCVLVLDKASRCFVSSSVIGKNVIINGIEARLMRFIYKKKYSKTNQKNISVKEGEI